MTNSTKVHARLHTETQPLEAFHTMDIDDEEDLPDGKTLLKSAKSTTVEDVQQADNLYRSKYTIFFHSRSV